MNNLKVIENAAALDLHIEQTIRKGNEYREALHLSAVSCLWHVAKHGNIIHLTKFFAALTKNDKNAFLAYVRKFQTVVNAEGEPIRDTFGRLQASDMQFLTVEKGEFRIIGGVMPNRLRFVKFAEEKLLPEADHWHSFFTVDVLKDAQMFGPQDILKTLKSLLKKATGGDDNLVVAGVPPKMIDLLKATFSQAESIAKNADITKTDPVQPKPTPDPVQPAKTRNSRSAKARSTEVALAALSLPPPAQQPQAGA